MGASPVNRPRSSWDPPFGEFEDATVVLTGVGRPGQVGAVVAAAFASRGASLVLIDRDLENARERAVEVAGHARQPHAFGCDLTEPGQVDVVVAEVSRLAPAGVQAVIHLAGGYIDGTTVADLDVIALNKLIAMNLTTAFVASRGFLPLVRRARGSMVYFSSAAALPGAAVKASSAYAAAKGGVITLMRAVAAEERAHGVRANALAPKAIRTDSNLASMGAEHDYVERETVAAWILWLCSSAAGPVTGQVIRLG